MGGLLLGWLVPIYDGGKCANLFPLSESLNWLNSFTLHGSKQLWNGEEMVPKRRMLNRLFSEIMTSWCQF